MNSAQTLDNLVRNWKSQGHTRAELLVLQAEAMLGWPYAWGASGQDCTPEKRQYFMNRSSISAGDANLIEKRCQVLNGSHALCSGCKYYPGGAKTRIQDCQGFMKEIHKAAGITLKGGGCTSMWNDNSNWSEKGLIRDLPSGAVCLVFKHISSTGKMDHVGLHIGGGNLIHCSGEVKWGKTSEKGWTHYAIPKGLEEAGSAGAGNQGGATMWRSTIRKGSRGADVLYCQDLLMALGYDVGRSGADSIFGANTREAVKAFQSDHSMADDGIVGPMTWDALEKAAEAGNPAPAAGFYTVTIPHLPESRAQELMKAYPGAEMRKEAEEE